jgi:hypothetical protein
MIDAVVKWVDYVDETPGDSGKPFMLAMTAGIGPRGDDSADNFQVVVCNVGWIGQQVRTNMAVWPRGFLIVERFELDHIKEVLQSLVQTFTKSDDWRVFAERLNRYLLWEYEDLDDFQGDVCVPKPRIH